MTTLSGRTARVEAMVVRRTEELTGANRRLQGEIVERKRAEDELKAAKPVEVVWHMHTAARIDVQAGGDQALLSQGGTQVMAQIAEPPGARFEVAPADPVPATQPSPPMRKTERLKEKLIVRLPGKVTELRLKVVLAPAQ